MIEFLKKDKILKIHREEGQEDKLRLKRTRSCPKGQGVAALVSGVLDAIFFFVVELGTMSVLHVINVTDIKKIN